MGVLRIPEAVAGLGARLKPFFAAHGKGLLVGLLALAAVVWLFRVARDDEGVMVYRLVETESGNLATRMAQGLRDRSAALHEFASAWEGRAPNQAQWESDADSLLRRGLELRGIEWVDTSLAVRWMRPFAARLPGAALDSIHDAQRTDELHALLSGGDATISRSFPLPEAPRQMLMAAPVRIGGVTGYFVAVFRANDLIDALVQESVQRGFSVSVKESQLQLFGPVWEDGGDESTFESDARVSVSDLGWDVMVWPSAEELKRMRSKALWGFLGVGLVLAIALGFAIDRLESWKRRALGGSRGGG